MTELLRELEAVVGRMEAIKAANWDVDTAELSATRIAVIDFVHDHHAEIAEALKDKVRMDWIERQLHMLTWNDNAEHVAIRAEDGADGIGDSWREAIDAAIDAHNSAREVGE